MAAIGLNVAADGRHAPETLRALGATWLRIVATPEYDLTGYLTRCRAAGLRVLLVLARESGADYSEYARRYAGRVDAVQVGNEPDLVSPSSWTLDPATLSALGRTVRQAFPTTPLVCAGLASGQPDWLRDVDLAPFDAVAVHPYLKDAPNPTDLEDLPDVPELLAAYRAVVPDKPLVVSEWGWWGHDERRGAEEVADMVRWAAETDQIALFCYFCADDGMVAPFGLRRDDGTEKPAAARFRAEAERARDLGWPAAAPAPAPETPKAPDPWQFFSAARIAEVTGCPRAAVEAHWPRLVEQLGHCGLNDRATQIALLGTVAIETASTFEPVREAFWLPESWRQANLRYYPWYGRGFIQLTWRENYAAYGPKIAALWGAAGWEPDFDLVGDPDRALDPDIAAAVAALYLRDHRRADGYGIPEAARDGNWREVRRLVQGADAGLDRLIVIAQALQAEPVPDPAPDPAPEPVPDPRDALIAAYELALTTLRDVALPALRTQLDECERIVSQFIGPRG